MSKNLDLTKTMETKVNNEMKGHKCLDVSGAIGNATKEETHKCCFCGKDAIMPMYGYPVCEKCAEKIAPIITNALNDVLNCGKYKAPE